MSAEWFAAAAATLASDEVAFVPAQDQLGANVSSPWTLRDALLVSGRMRRKAGPLACWEWRGLVGELNAALARLGSALDEVDAERWSNAAGRTRQEVIDLLLGCAEDDVDVPSAATLRPWCDPSLLRTCRVPFVPLAALVHAWSARSASVAEIVEHFGLAETTDPWTLLDRVDAEIAFTEAPDDVAAKADVFRGAMASRVPELHSPCALLCLLVEHSPAADLEASVDLAQSLPSVEV